MAKRLQSNNFDSRANKNHTCNQCSFSCDAPSQLKRHMLVHTGEKPFACSQCKYTYNQARDLRTHMLTHSGEKPYHCKQCEFSCTGARDLKRHILTHSQEKPFNCNQCTSSFTTSQHIQGRSPSVVISATTHASKLLLSRHTCGSTKEKNPLHVISAASLSANQAI